jgi:formylglycine-generating enzyme required for sulfatase activity/serine/threonine protein kinase
MPALFISYRRADSPDTVKLLYERLRKRLPRWEIFYDIESIPLGEHFLERLRPKVASATVVLVIIGPRWLDLLQERKSAGADHVRTEVRLALEAGTSVVPVPVGRATLPTDADLADFPDLQPLLKCNGRPVRPDPDFDGDLEPIIAYVKQFESDETLGATLADKYTLTAEIGHGGMGVVYRAEQKQPVQRTVAVKLIKPGMDSRDVLARFEAERQALAVMDHPSIAKVHDAGMTAQGRPFFVMEYVNGKPLTRYCDDKKLTPQERLNLFILVCNAVQHAHQKGIIHRDLKPNNVLVEVVDGKPVPKVIDFGLAKALGHKLTDKTLYTDVDKRVGTLEYSAPEQAAGRSLEVDTRSDIYSLGVVLYELLTGTPPFTHEELLKIGEEEMRRVIREKEPTKPSKKLSSSGELPAIAAKRQLEPNRLTRLVRGDLDWIVMKCLEKERDRRYKNANNIGEELQRFLADEPVQAGPPSAAYRLRKFIRRHKTGLLTIASVLLAMVLGVAGIVWKYFDAEQQADKATKARDFLVSIFRISETDARGGNITAREILADAEKRIPVEFADQPELRRELLDAIEGVNRNIERTIPAAMLLEARGAVQIHSARGASQPAVPQVLLFPDDRLTLAADAAVKLVFLADLHQEQIQRATETIIGRKGCEPAAVVSRRDNSLLMTFVHLPKGTFYMGWDGTKGSAKKTPIQEDFEIAVHTVTQGQWQAVMGNNPSYFSRRGNARYDVVDISDEELKLFPVESVSWDDVQAFLKKLNEKERGSGYLYGLATEAEWEYACRGGASSEEECSYHFYFAKPTNDLSSEQANFNGNYPSGNAPKGKYPQRPTRVGAYPPNKLGLCDMHGNVWQWCADEVTPGGSARVVRGGSWLNPGSFCQAAFRDGLAPEIRSDALGFRLARVPRPVVR